MAHVSAISNYVCKKHNKKMYIIDKGERLIVRCDDCEKDKELNNMERKSNGQFTSRGLMGNQYAKGNPPNKGSFDGSMNGAKHPHWKGGIQKLRDCYYIVIASGKRQVRARYNWEQEYGEIPKGMIIYKIDGNKYNDELENLELITRAELLRKNNNK